MTDSFDVTVIDRSDRSARFLVEGVTPAFANGIRRAILADVPTLSIDTVRIIENSSVMFDEQIGLRLGLIPLTTPDDYEPGEEVTLALDVSGPGVAYSGDLVSSDPQVEPAETNVPIIELKEGQRLEIEADAMLGRGKDHAKYQGGVAVGYQHLQRIDVIGDLGEFEEEEPQIIRGVIDDDGELIPTEEFDHDLSNRYPGKEVTIEDVPNAFVFHIETDGSLAVEDLVTNAVQTIEDRAIELEEAVSL